MICFELFHSAAKVIVLLRLTKYFHIKTNINANTKAVCFISNSPLSRPIHNLPVGFKKLYKRIEF